MKTRELREGRQHARVFFVKQFALFITMTSVLVSCSETASIGLKARPASWAQPIVLSGVENLHRVSDELYRSAQPSEEGMAQLEKLGIKTVINLRALHKDDELEKTHLGSEQIALWSWNLDEEADERFFALLDKSPKPVLVHCWHGADRTGALCARYRVEKQGWSAEDAITEMMRGGFGFHSIWEKIPEWVYEQSNTFEPDSVRSFPDI